MKTARLYFLLFILVLLTLLRTNAATIIGTLKTSGGVALSTNIVYVPLSTPIGGTSTVYEGTPITNKSGTDGTFSLTLGPGRYRVWIATLPTAYSYITIPDDSNSYNLSQLLTNGLAITNAFVATTPASRSFLLLTNTEDMLTYLGASSGVTEQTSTNIARYFATNSAIVTSNALYGSGVSLTTATNIAEFKATNSAIVTSNYFKTGGSFTDPTLAGEVTFSGATPGFMFISTGDPILTYRTLTPGTGMTFTTNETDITLASTGSGGDWGSYSTNALTEKLASNVWQNSWGALGTNALTDKLGSNTYLGNLASGAGLTNLNGAQPTNNTLTQWSLIATGAITTKLESNAVIGSFASLANSAGMLTNDGAGVLGYMTIPSGGSGSTQLVTFTAGSGTITNALTAATFNVNTNYSTNVIATRLQIGTLLVGTNAYITNALTVIGPQTNDAGISLGGTYRTTWPSGSTLTILTNAVTVGTLSGLEIQTNAVTVGTL